MPPPRTWPWRVLGGQKSPIRPERRIRWGSRRGGCPSTCGSSSPLARRRPLGWRGRRLPIRGGCLPAGGRLTLPSASPQSRRRSPHARPAGGPRRLGPGWQWPPPPTRPATGQICEGLEPTGGPALCCEQCSPLADMGRCQSSERQGRPQRRRTCSACRPSAGGGRLRATASRLPA